MWGSLKASKERHETGRPPHMVAAKLHFHNRFGASEMAMRARDMTLSPDRKWLWDGKQWTPVWVPGPAVKGRGPERWLIVTGVVWLFAVASWMLAGTVVVATMTPPSNGQ